MDIFISACVLGAAYFMKTDQTEHELEQPVSQFLLWTGLLLPPLAWSADLETVYLFSDYACEYHNFLPNHIASGVFLLISLIGGLIAWNNWLRSGAIWPNGSSGVVASSRFLSALGLLSAALFSTLILAQWLPTIVGVPCGK